MAHVACSTSRRRPPLEVADILKKYRRFIHPSPAEAKVVHDIMACRTEKLGGHVMECEKCGRKELSYNSCRNRHCPKCQFLRKERWIEDRLKDLLPVKYFHVVFTVPHELNQLTLQNKTILYNILFRAASETLKQVARTKLNGDIGFISVLHTWGQTLMPHPHLHVIVPGGGLKNNNAWESSRRGYFLPVKVLSLVFRGKFLSYLEAARQELNFEGAIAPLSQERRFKDLLTVASTKPWQVYAKESFKGPEQVINYLGQYTHRIAISNHRLIKLDDDKVHFRYRDYADENKTKIMVLPVVEFIDRFLTHVLPYKFPRIRHFGLLGNRNKTQNLILCRKLLGETLIATTKSSETKTWEEKLKDLTGIDLTKCQDCGGLMRRKRTLLPLAQPLDTS